MAAPVLPAVYLPGASGDGAVWAPIAERLARRRSPILIDYPGLGDAPADPSVASLADLTQYVLQRLPAACDVISMSMGSALALRLAIAHPERVRCLVLVTAAGGVDVRGLGGLDWRAAFCRRRPYAPRWFVDDTTDLSSQLGLVRAPTLLVYGDQDLIAPVSVGEYLLARLPSARLEILEHGSHDLDEEAPDLLASWIEAHLRRGAPGVWPAVASE